MLTGKEPQKRSFMWVCAGNRAEHMDSHRDDSVRFRMVGLDIKHLFRILVVWPNLSGETLIFGSRQNLGFVKDQTFHDAV
jgi:hypothetical protein